MKWYSKILPYILVILTRAERYKPEFSWSNLWVVNLFRVYESIFWRKYGIRPEGATYSIDDKIYTYSYTLESYLANIEVIVRSLLKRNFGFSIVRIPQMQLAGLSRGGISPYRFAIAYDNSLASSTGSTTSPVTLSYVVTGSNTAIFVGYSISVISTMTGITYDSAALAQIQSDFIVTGPGEFLGMWYLSNCNTGTKDIVYTFSSGNLDYRGAASYSGVNPGAVDGSDGAAVIGAGNDVSTITPSATNCWHMMVCNCQNASLAAGSGTTERAQNLNAFAFFDSNGTVTAGSPNTITATNTTTFGSAYVGATFAPVQAAAASGGARLLNLLGIGN